jgi:hypothetical protein
VAGFFYVHQGQVRLARLAGDTRSAPSIHAISSSKQLAEQWAEDGLAPIVIVSSCPPHSQTHAHKKTGHKG